MFFKLKIDSIANIPANPTTNEGNTIGMLLPKYGTLIIDEYRSSYPVVIGFF